MQLTFGIGTGTQSVEVAQQNLLSVLLPQEVAVPADQQALIREAIAHPVGTPPLEAIVRPGQKIAIVTSDITRPMPTGKVLPVLLEKLYACGAAREDICLVFGLGSHRKHTDAEHQKLMGTAYGEIRCYDSDPEGCVHFGTTQLGTPVDIDRHVAQADVRICLGNIEYHYFAGYSGGAKAIMPGVSTRAAIQSNHKWMVHPKACVRSLEGNPVREDIEEAAAMVGVDFIVNVVLNEHKQIVHAVAGHLVQAHRAGCAFLDTLYMREIPALADIVIVSQGGAPKDLNLYQTQKALENSKYAVRPGGIIILVGSCREGMGEKHFEDWMLEEKTPEDVLARLARGFVLGGHKAAAIAMVCQKADIYFVSEMEPQLVERIFMTPFATVEEAYQAAVAKLGAEAKVIAMPYGGSTLPKAE